jgi:2-keto-4-pentenoate hydratase
MPSLKLTNRAILQLAERQLADYDSQQPGSIFRQGADFLTVQQAYRLQLQVATIRLNRGEGLAGYKVGCTSPAIQKQFGLKQPVFAHLFASELRRTGAVLDPDRYECLAIEGEFAFRIRADIPGAVWLRRHAREAIASAFPVIELHNYIFRTKPPTTTELVASNALNVGVVLPLEEFPVDDPHTLKEEEITVFRNGQSLGVATGKEIPHGPFGSLLWLADRLRLFGTHLKRNQIVLAGSPLPLFPVQIEDDYLVKCRRLGSVECSIGKRS